MRDKLLGTLYGLAYGDAVGFASLFHRFHVLPAKRHDFLFETNKRLSRERILPLALPFTHRQPEDTLSPAPTDDTEFAVFAAKTLAAIWPQITQEKLVAKWREDFGTHKEEIWTRFSERAALDNFELGVFPPDSGNDNPLHYEDAAVSRAVGLALLFDNPARAAEVAAMESSISQAEDGVWGAQAMAFAVSALVGGGDLNEALSGAELYFPADSWIAEENRKAAGCAREAQSDHDLPLLLAESVINNVYSFGNAAPETVPAAFAIARRVAGVPLRGVLLANSVAKAGDSLPAFVGAICGAAQGASSIGELWVKRLDGLRGVCLPFLGGTSLSTVAEEIEEVRRQS